MRRRAIVPSLCALVAALLLLCEAPSVRATESKEAAFAERRFEFTYEVEVPAIPAGTGPVDLFIPLAQSDDHQTIEKHRVESSIPGSEKTEDEYGNRFWHGHLGKSDGKPLTVKVAYQVVRRVHQVDGLEELEELEYTKEDLEGQEKNLKATSRTPVKGELIDKIKADLPKPDKPTPIRVARVIYDYVVDTMDYKKVGEGWGNGDTHWACSKKYGNCTDFHALFMSLARSENIPSRFEIGFPLPTDAKQGVIPGYHCWVTFKLPVLGWAPIDASEAKKNLKKKELYFGTHPADRIKFTEGRDIRLGDGHTTAPLNYFIYPHLEVAGAQSKEVKTQFSFVDLPPEQR